MVHTFECLNRFFALDVESGSFFEIDGAVYAILSGGDTSRFSAEELFDAQREVDELKSQNILFYPEPEHKTLQYSPVVKALCLNISHNCNLACTYCFASGGTYNDIRRHMSFDVAKASIDFLVESSGTRRNLEVDFFGGEPMLNLEVVKKTVVYARSIEKANNKNFRFTITTNALKLTDEDIEYFNKEMHNVVISIDGRKDVHNLVRKSVTGGDTFDEIIKNALNFKSKRVGQYYVRGTFTAKNLDFASDVLFLNDLGFDQLSIEPVVLEDGNPLAITPDDYPRILTEYERLAGEYIERRKTDKWFNFFHFMIDFDNSPCEAKRIKGCGAGCEYLAVAPNGSIYPCHRFDGTEDMLLGNVSDGVLDENMRKRFFECSVLSKPECRSCWAKYYCSGGCMANSYFENHDLNKPFGGACEMMRKRIECALAVKAIESEENQ